MSVDDPGNGNDGLYSLYSQANYHVLHEPSELHGDVYEDLCGSSVLAEVIPHSFS